MKVIIGNQYYSTLDASTVSITRSVSDPVPTCQLTLTDQNSTISIPKPSEIIVLDEKVIPNPTVNLLQNPSLNPYNTNWLPGASGPVGNSQIGGGGVQMAYTSASSGSFGRVSQGGVSVRAGQSYLFSVYVQGTVTPANIEAIIQVQWTDAVGNLTGTIVNTISSISTSLTRYDVAGATPANTSFAFITLQTQATANGVTGTIAFTQTQLEPMWFPTLSYPTPFCGPSQTNCVQLPSGQWIRQYRKFGGFVNDVQPGNYRGNTRDYVINAVGYAWLLSTIYVPDSFTSKTDAQIMTSLLNTYLVNTPPNGASNAMCTTTNIVSSGITLSSFGSNWDDLRTLFNNLAAQSTFYWTVDDYWNAVYAPYGYFSMQIELVLDNSANPNMVTTFPGYTVSAEEDFTQPGSTILVIGSGTNVAKVIDPAQTANIGMISGYFLPVGTAWMRKVNASSLGSVADCTQRGMAELLQYDYERDILNATTNEELFAGYGVRVADVQDGYSGNVLLIQQVTATWIGTNETLTDEWEYAAVLGAVNRNATNILSRLARNTNSNTSAPAISSTTLAVLENVAIADTIDGGSLYAETVLSDNPLRYYRLGEPAGFSITTAYDWTGNANGTINGTVTFGTTGLIYNDSNTAMTFDGSTGYISAATTGLPTGAAAWAVECWCQVSSLPVNQWNAMVGFGTRASSQMGAIYMNNTSGVYTFQLGFFGSMLVGSTFVVGSTYHVVGTYDGVNARLYVNGVLVAGPTPFTLNVALAYCNVGADGAVEFYPGTLDEVAIYPTALSAARIQAHYNIGTTGHS